MTIDVSKFWQSPAAMIATSSHKPCYIVYKNSLSIGLRENLLYYIFYVTYQVLESEWEDFQQGNSWYYVSNNSTLTSWRETGTCKMLLKASHGIRKEVHK